MAQTRVVAVSSVAFQNEATRFVPVPPLRRPVTVDDEPEWQRVLERLQVWRAEHIEHDALAVVVRTPGAPPALSATALSATALSATLASADGEPAALIVGRHARADAHLPGASLRQAAVLLWPEPSGARVVAVDLRTPSGLATHRGIARRISSDAALHFGAGDADVFALVAARDRPFAVRSADQLEAVVSGALVDDAVPPPAPASSAWERSVVLRTAALPMPVRDTLVVRATRDEILRGVVLGRYERCHRTQALSDSLEVSRVHALLFAAADALWIVDTGSTSGTRVVDGARAIDLGEGRRIARLSPRARVLLAGVEVVVDIG